MTDATSLTSIIIPCRNEEKHIAKCLDSIISQDYPKERIEILVVDGMSHDKTREIVDSYCKQYHYIKRFDNLKKIAPSAMNIGIKNARGDLIIRMDAHNLYKSDYVAKCVKYIHDYDVDNVGGIWLTVPSNDTTCAKSIALALSHSFGVGNSRFRIGIKTPELVDTVPFGCYRKEVFAKIGLFDEDLVRNQDDEFNLRLIKNGGKILLAPEIISYYHARGSLKQLWNMYFQYGYFKPLVARKIGAILTLRQLMPAILIGSLIFFGLLSIVSKYFFMFFLFILLLYIAANIIASIAIAARRDPKLIFVLPLAFGTLHFSYGIGYLKGIWDFLIIDKNQKKQILDMPLTR